MLENSDQMAQLIFKFLTENNHTKLEKYLKEQGSLVDVVELTESRQYTALAFSAFKNHQHCFKIILEHGIKYNLPLGLNRKPTVKSLQAWANQSTDEEFTALHFATYHGNYELIKILVEEMHADFTAKNMYGANVLHIAA